MKQHLVIGIYKLKCKIHCKVVSIYSLFSEKLHFHSQHTSCVSYYDDIINHDVT